MKNMYRSGILPRLLICAAVFGTVCTVAADQAFAQAPKKSAKTPKKGRGNDMEYDAQAMLKKGIEYLEMKQEERGVKTITQVTLQYPESKAAFQAEVVLGNYYIEKRQYDLAVKRLQKVAQHEDPEIQAEALYKIGICYFNSGEYNKAFLSLRQVTNKFPGSVHANEAYYYIGLCHFSLNRWTQAVDALERVGTSVNAQNKTPEAKTEAGLLLAEAGQRLFVKIQDEDLAVLITEDSGKVLKVRLTNENGDEETIELEGLGKEGATFIGSIATQPGIAAKNDGTLQIKGGDKVQNRVCAKITNPLTNTSTKYPGISNLLPGTVVCYDVIPVASQSIFPATKEPQVFKARVKVSGDGSVLNSGIAYFLVPPVIDDSGEISY